ncbi:MAG: hypothetical protein MJZ55_02505 [Paludibacteraceae bacterium]|nr:hypothetical protein [Paludibacteraceae bacterium]
MKKLIILCIASLCLIACESKKESPLYALIYFDELSWEKEYVQGNSMYRLVAEVGSTTSTIRHIKVTSYDPVHLDGVILDSVIEDPVKKLKFSIPYRTPIYEENTHLQIIIKAYANDGETVQYKIIPTVLSSDKPLRPIDDVTLYSALSNRPSYFSLETMTPFMGDTTMRGLYFRDVAPMDSSASISYSWTSPTIYFARFQSFNFAEATEQSVINAYKECKRDRTIQDLKADDILLFGTADSAIGALKIIYIADELEKVNDRYVFSIKTIEKK